MTEVRITQTWLTRRLRDGSSLVSALGVAVIALVSMLAWRQIAGFDLLLPASGEAIFGRHEWWRAWTAIFVHGDGGHLLSNSLFLLIFGALLYGSFGAWVYPTAALFFGGLVNLATVALMEPHVRLIGASGVVYWMGGAWLALYLGIHRTRPFGPRFLRATGVAAALFLPTEAFNPSVSYPAHAIGFAFGVLFGALVFAAKRATFRAAEVQVEIRDEPAFPPEKTPL